uniref:Uncharacterized protein n=1 Tax=Anguilla anguilla TaxID=7936 RepID=A0A0E9XW72_ANGAN
MHLMMLLSLLVLRLQICVCS